MTSISFVSVFDGAMYPPRQRRRFFVGNGEA